MRKETIKKRMIKYTVIHKKASGGDERIGDNHFVTPEGDGIELVDLMNRLPEGHLIRTVIIVKEE